MKQHAFGRREPPTPDTSFRLRLQAELAARCARNPNYSLRALARDLDTDGSSLSQLLRGKRKLSGPAIERLGARLGLGADAIARYVAGELRWAEEEAVADDEMPTLARDAASVLSEWEHAALLELVHLDGFVPDSRWIARMLDVSVDTVNLALHRLLRLRMLEMASDGRWIDRCGDLRATSSELSPSMVAALASRLEAVIARSGSEGVRTVAITLSIPSSRAGELEARIARLSRELAELETGAEPRDALYRVEVQLYPMLRAERAP